MMIEVFTGENELFDRLLVVSDDAVYVSNPDKEKVAGIASKIREGTPVNSVVPDADAIRYAAVSSVKANRFRDDLNIYHQQAGKTRMRNITFKDAAHRDTALQALERRLAPRFTKAEVQYGVVRAALVPLLTTAALAALTYVSYMAAGGVAAGEAVDIHGRARTQKRNVRVGFGDPGTYWRSGRWRPNRPWMHRMACSACQEAAADGYAHTPQVSVKVAQQGDEADEAW